MRSSRSARAALGGREAAEGGRVGRPGAARPGCRRRARRAAAPAATRWWSPSRCRPRRSGRSRAAISSAEGVGDALDAPSQAAGLVAELVAGRERAHDVEGVGGVAAVGGGSVSGPSRSRNSMIDPGHPCVRTRGGRRGAATGGRRGRRRAGPQARVSSPTVARNLGQAVSGARSPASRSRRPS